MNERHARRTASVLNPLQLRTAALIVSLGNLGDRRAGGILAMIMEVRSFGI